MRTGRVARPLSINIFAALFSLSCVLSLAPGSAARTISFGFALLLDAASELARHIFEVRLAGLAFALTLFVRLYVVASVGARGALAVR